MVMKKRLDNGFNGFSDWTVPRGPRSLRKVHGKKDFEDGQICAIELLASLAGKLLQDGESMAYSNTSDGDHSVIGTNVVKEERSNKEKAFKVECCDAGSSQSCDLDLEKTDQKQNLKKLQYVDNNTVLDCTSVIVNSNSLDEACGDVKPVIRKTEFEDYHTKPEEGSPDFLESTDTGMNIVNEEHEAKGFGIGFQNMAHSHNFKDLKKSYGKSPTMANSSFKTKLPLSTDAIRSSFSRYRNYFKLASRDDDEKFRSNKSSIHSNSYRPPSRIAGRRIRKLLNSKHWKAAPKLKDCEITRSESIDEEARNPFRKRKLYFNSERYQGDSLYKRRRFSDRSSMVNSDGGMSSESVTNSPEKSIHNDKSGLAAILHEGQEASFLSKDTHVVKFSIRSFKVPELFIDVPENATVGSLKKIVLEAVTAILKDGLHVGVLVHGKKVRDDNRTLLQTGLTCKDNLDTVGFTLEPNLVHNTTPALCPEDPPQMLACDTTELLPSSPVNPVSSSGILDVTLPNTTLTNSQDESKHELTTTSIDKLPDNSLQDCKALIPVPEMNMEALAVVPLNPKSKRSEVVQRRTRRPFSVSEVEALVQAVEELGTGRWRDVKFRAFENADHRTYVDLKDKWKTLVHTARISPQQRRGEPVPQELLDRVLAAHAYWSQHQAKQHGGKHLQAGVVKAIEGSSS
ncbi:telomere repeat-binding protein 4-like isoform X2 [Benincasa hispida]|uniref:telomere repeat-binding protein 4-like isoform X2 n=1 Tax=Benincasa hispida TaxID=102211 RepID=UPI0018FF39DB|nr:telomere repeat-binding protein 4-like isoform X2 [Benincasa hispida]